MREYLIPMITVMIGLGYTISGYLIAIKKKFHLITNHFFFRRQYTYFKKFATRHGKIELIGGTAVLGFGCYALYARDARIALVSAVIGVISILIALKLNKLLSKKNFYF